MKEVTLVLGTFDGVHLGHQALIKAASAFPQPVVAVTFDRHPLSVLNPAGAPQLLTDRDVRDSLLISSGADCVDSLHFDLEMAGMPPEDFIRMILEKRNARQVVCGFNYRFGAGASGTPELLEKLGEELGFRTVCVGAVTLDGQNVSSTAIRACILSGDIAGANQALGHPLILRGTVREGKRLGHTLGFPTLNVPIREGHIVPRRGVYVTAVRFAGRWFRSITNVGNNPTTDVGIPDRTETYLFEPDLIPTYGDAIEVAFFDFLRPERIFEGVEALREEIERNKAQALCLHREKESLYKSMLPW